MSTKHIPATTEVTCDCCGVVCSGSFGPGRRVQEGRLLVKQHALDYLGSPAACGDVSFDLCDSCLGQVVKAVNSLFDEIREGSQP